jgi:hypothetical protein
MDADEADKLIMGAATVKAPLPVVLEVAGVVRGPRPAAPTTVVVVKQTSNNKLLTINLFILFSFLIGI